MNSIDSRNQLEVQSALFAISNQEFRAGLARGDPRIRALFDIALNISDKHALIMIEEVASIREDPGLIDQAARSTSEIMKAACLAQNDDFSKRPYFFAMVRYTAQPWMVTHLRQFGVDLKLYDKRGKFVVASPEPLGEDKLYARGPMCGRWVYSNLVGESELPEALRELGL